MDETSKMAASSAWQNFSVKEKEPTTNTSPSESLEQDILKTPEKRGSPWVKDIVLNDSSIALGVHTIYLPEQLNMIHIPNEKYLCIVSYQNFQGRLKTIQLCIITSTKVDSYTILMDKLYSPDNKESLKMSRLAYFLTSNEVNRGMWELEAVQGTLIDLGIGAGPSVNLPMVVKVDSRMELNLIKALEHYLPDWKDLSVFKEKQEAMKNMPSSLWNQKDISEEILEYNAYEGLALGKLYQFIYDKSHAKATQ